MMQSILSLTTTSHPFSAFARLRSRIFRSSSLNSSSSSFLFESAAERRKVTVASSVASPPAKDTNAREGAPPEECRRLRSLLCGPGSERLPGRFPGGGVVCPRRASCASCTTSSLIAVAVFCLRGAEWCVASATAIATVIRSWRCH